MHKDKPGMVSIPLFTSQPGQFFTKLGHVTQSISKWDIRFMRIAREKATWSKDPSTQCGAVIVDACHREMGSGYNGFPRGVYDTEEHLHDREQKYPRIMHAELNACLFINRMGMLPPFRMYVYPLAPCSQCMGAIIQAGITEVITLESTPELLERWGKSNEIAEEMALQAGVLVRRIPEKLLSASVAHSYIVDSY